MAVYTDLSDDDLASVARAYGLGAVRTCKGIAEGVSNSNYFIDADAGRFIFTIFEHRAAPEDLPFFIGVMEHLAARGFPAPAPLHARTGAALYDLRGKNAAFVSFLDGVSPKHPNRAQCAIIGETLARMHGTLADCPLTRANALGPANWRALIAPHLSLAEQLRSGLAQSIDADLTAITGAWPQALPRGIIHADLFPDNALFIGDALGGVIDFYFACEDLLAYDIAVALNAWCFEARGEYDISKGAALLGGYESVRKLESAERLALPLLARGAAMRFFATRIADWAHTPAGALVRPKDPLEYAAKLDFHRAAKSAGDYGVDRGESA